ncbi:MAG: prevent-host-death protein, partial [Deltaproteobacteria bacterium]
MQIFTSLEAKQNFSRILDMADSADKVLIRRKDGKTYSLTSKQREPSPLDVPSINAN